ncbi:ATP-binding cassette domain-containing protein, partial [Paraburkholderia aspalathi]|nr:ATP-binding cassette domain-containing protein [Paraburkholderia aspalathi]
EFGSTTPGGLFTHRQLIKRWTAHLKSLDINVDLNTRIRDLPVETQQGVEIARALVTDAKLLILDEPTAVLSPAGIEMLFERVRKLKERGVTVILILHKIREVLGIADTVTVLRNGKLIDRTIPCAGIRPDQLAAMIIGDAAKSFSVNDAGALVGMGSESDIVTEQKSHAINIKAAPILQLTAVSTLIDTEGPALEAMDFMVRPGEIVGIAGVEGNGQRTLVRAIANLVDMRGGKVSFLDEDVTLATLAERRSKGLRIIPFERNTEGLSTSSSLWENWSARELLQGNLLGFINPARIRARCDEALKNWAVKYHSSSQVAGSLSGGNAQKVILAREVDPAAKLIIAAQPTRGLDIGATDFVWRALRVARDRGCGIILVSSDLDELFDISDRVVVMLSGRIAGEFQAPYDIHAVGAAMTGVTQ